MSGYTARGRQKGTGFENVVDSLFPDGPLADGPVEYQPADEGLVAALMSVLLMGSTRTAQLDTVQQPMGLNAKSTGITSEASRQRL